jgi:hypothetical protein
MNSAITDQRDQIENAAWSPAIVHSRLRRAIILLPASQAALSSGFQSVMRWLRPMRYSPFVDGVWEWRGDAASSGDPYVVGISRMLTPVDLSAKSFGRVERTGWRQPQVRSAHWRAYDPPRRAVHQPLTGAAGHDPAGSTHCAGKSRSESERRCRVGRPKMGGMPCRMFRCSHREWKSVNSIWPISPVS